MKEIPLTKGKVAIVDDEDFEFLNRFIWRINQDQGKGCDKAVAQIGGHSINMHYLLIDQRNYKDFPVEITKKNKNFLDYRKENILVMTRAEMRQFNRKRSDNTSGYKGVWIHRPTQKAFAEVQKDGKRYRLGYFETTRDAAIAYNKKARELFGDNAYQNIIRN